MRCGGRVCWANAELCAQSDGCSRKAVQGSRGCGACWAGERLRRAVRGLVGRELRCDVRCGLSRASAGCRGGGLRASCAWGCGMTYTKGRLVTSSLNDKQLSKDGWDNSHKMAK